MVSSASLVLTKLVSAVSKGKRGTIFGLQGFTTNLGLILGSLMGRVIWENYGRRGPFLFSIAVELVIAFVYIGLMKVLLCQVNEAAIKNQMIIDIGTPDVSLPT